ncbi:unnamed protein product [Acanthoscelides obtectus]|uniref:Uncharacterized protein n=1 Tax=Acanthoscelides obtectus TaxID=200917 RepID=A0A9P0KXH9_ACAOB|nr:unnamed protein product [Acanthoscelides obtectus]CAK1630048.1 hypothetical protein AOBTE_LOCUS6127 [Acanthoscelides obtectus]
MGHGGEMSLYFTPGSFSSFTRLSKNSSEQFSRILISLETCQVVVNKHLTSNLKTLKSKFEMKS